MTRALLGALALAAACFDPHYDQPSCAIGTECPAGYVCRDQVCVVASAIDAFDDGPDGPEIDAQDAAIDATSDPDADAGPCLPGCDGATLTVCGPTGPTTEVCGLGCATSPAPHCRTFSPSNSVNVGDLAGATADLDVPAGRLFVLDTDDGSIDSFDLTAPSGPSVAIRGPGDGVNAGIGFRRTTQPGSPVALAIWSMNTLRVNAGASRAMHGTVRLVGSRAATLLARGDIAVHGAMDAGAGRTSSSLTCRECGGPGGGNGATRSTLATGCAPGGNGAYSTAQDETGGAGGGMSTSGAAGGDSDAAGGTVASITTCSGVELIPLQGGSGGGRGGFDAASPAGGEVGGGGGGAIQLTSLTSISVVGTADVYAGGNGGAGSDFDYGGGGGGAGGAILLEAPTVTIGQTARLTANGGGGGSGRTANAGEAGARGASRAAGGAGDGPGSNDGRGGLGGITSTGTAALLPAPGGGAVDGTGGGGAAAGRIRINTATGPPTIGGTTVISPAYTVGARPVS